MLTASHDGKLIDRFVGAKSDAEVSEFLSELLKKGGSNDVMAMMEEADVKIKEGEYPKNFPRRFSDYCSYFSVQL